MQYIGDAKSGAFKGKDQYVLVSSPWRLGLSGFLPRIDSETDTLRI